MDVSAAPAGIRWTLAARVVFGTQVAGSPGEEGAPLWRLKDSGQPLWSLGVAAVSIRLRPWPSSDGAGIDARALGEQAKKSPAWAGDNSVRSLQIRQPGGDECGALRKIDRPDLAGFKRSLGLAGRFYPQFTSRGHRENQRGRRGASGSRYPILPRPPVRSRGADRRHWPCCPRRAPRRIGRPSPSTSARICLSIAPPRPLP